MRLCSRRGVASLITSLKRSGTFSASPEAGAASATDAAMLGAALRALPVRGASTYCTSTGMSQIWEAKVVMRPANWVFTQSSLKRFGAAMRSRPSSKTSGARGLIQALNCCGVNSCSNCAEQVCQKLSINRLTERMLETASDGFFVIVSRVLKRHAFLVFYSCRRKLSTGRALISQPPVVQQQQKQPAK